MQISANIWIFVHVLLESGYFSCFPWNFTREIAIQPTKIDPLAHAWPFTAVLGNGSSCTILLPIAASNVLYRANTSSFGAVQKQMQNKKVLNLKLVRWYKERCWNISLVRGKHDLFRKNIARHFASILLAFSSQLRTAKMTNLNEISFILNFFHAIKIQENLVC